MTVHLQQNDLKPKKKKPTNKRNKQYVSKYVITLIFEKEVKWICSHFSLGKRDNPGDTVLLTLFLEIKIHQMLPANKLIIILQ